jgi:hypothetical protein
MASRTSAKSNARRATDLPPRWLHGDRGVCPTLQRGSLARRREVIHHPCAGLHVHFTEKEHQPDTRLRNHSENTSAGRSDGLNGILVEDLRCGLRRRDVESTNIPSLDECRRTLSRRLNRGASITRADHADGERQTCSGQSRSHTSAAKRGETMGPAGLEPATVGL